MTPLWLRWNGSSFDGESSFTDSKDESGMLSTLPYVYANTVLCRCFPHIVNLACQEVLDTITKLEYAAEDADDFVPPENTGYYHADRDPIACIRSLIRSVGCSCPVCCQ
jgi:hypothetical protein